ncbi:hypothetical protein [Clostridium sp. ZBS14]|uniref:hypothetical protein n=1 Tax=Clostridium sp. ZBS14 TaxID=2949970 RepID=UPI00207AAC90|nr:hypothetical protein [Clostridium sp. ZBS14]
MIEKYKKSLVAPLDKDELHIFNITNSLEKSIQEILKIVNDRAHGIYLVGGMRGSGKTSTINLCSAKYWRSNLIRITINCNKIIGIESFIYFFIEELYENIKDLKLPVEIYDEINDIRMKIRNNVSNKQVNKNDMLKKETSKIDKSSEAGQTYKQSIFNNRLEFLKKIIYKEYNSAIDEISSGINITEEIQEKNDEFILINRISEILIKISEQEEEYNIIIIIDEMDKQNKKFIEDLLDLYKNLFLNSHITTFFIVDLLNYLEINLGNELDNRLLSYFIKSIYIPTINDDDIKDYLYREFGVDNYKEVIIVNYLTCGVLRKINTYKYLEGYEERDIFLKAYIYNLILSKSELVGSKLYIKDLYKIFLKEVIEEFFYKNYIYSSYIREYMKNREEKYSYKYDFYKVIMDSLMKICTEMDYIKYIILSQSEIKYFLNKEVMHKLVYEYTDKKIQYTFDKYQVSKINNYFNEKQPKYIKISNNQPYDGNDIIHLIETLQRNVENLYIVKKIMVFMGSEHYSYSAILEINRSIGRVMYSIEDFSFSYEDSWSIKALKNFIRNNGIKLIEIETDDEPIEQNIDYIRDMLCKKIEGEN